jgi:hypothetical protein
MMKMSAKTIVCNIFNLQAQAKEDTLHLVITTDLPANTKVQVKVTREFIDTNDHSWEWTALDKTYSIKPPKEGINGLLLQQAIVDLDTKGLHVYRKLKGSMQLMMRSPPTSTLLVSIEAPAKEHTFGICNRQLTGKAVIVEIHGHILHASQTLKVALAEIVREKLKYSV